MGPRVSVGMPVYNAEAFLPEALESLLAQSFGDFEVIISDNASTDGTQEICRSFEDRDPRVHYTRNDTNIGIVPNFNRLFGLARGDYFKWAACDDLVAPKYLARCVESLDADPTVVLVAPRVRSIEEDGTPVRFAEDLGLFVTRYGETIPPANPTEDLRSSNPRKRFRCALLNLSGPLHAQFYYGVIRSEALAKTPLMEKYVGAERVMLARLSLMGSLVEIPEDLFFRRYHPAHFGGLSPRVTAERMDPDRSRIFVPLGRQIPGYARAVMDSKITPASKIGCLAVIAEKMVRAASGRTRRAIAGPSRWNRDRMKIAD